MNTLPIRIFHAILLCVMILKPFAIMAETVAIPIFLNYPQLQLLMAREMFKGPGNTLKYLLDDDGCSAITLSEPHLSAEGALLRVDAKTLATIGTGTTGGCATMTRWTGRTVVLGKPVLMSRQPLSVQFRVQAARLYDQQDRLLSENLIMQAFEERLHQVLNQFRLDLKPATDQLKALLPSVLSRYSADRLTGMIDSLRIGQIMIRPNGLDFNLTIDVENLTQAEPEPALSSDEIQQLEQRCRTWDAFLTFVIKQAATATRSESLRSALLDILLDVRYQFGPILRSSPGRGSDPVRGLFIRSWERLEPVMREISIDSPEQTQLSFLSFMTAADTLKALDRLGPAVGLDISSDGLRRLARLLNDNPSIDPLQYLDEIDPELQQLFDFGIPEETPLPKKTSRFRLELIRPAFAASPPDRLDRWVPSTAELDPYLREIRNLLLQEADARIHSSPIIQEYARVFRKLMLAAAWQESCWRQYILHKSKIVPLISGSGDVGLLQINERVWRGFYAPQKLRWNIVYNARAGSEILLKFMVNYALKQQEHKEVGGLTNLARATYCAYNGGPSQVSRYRKGDVPAIQKKIDAAFLAKYRQVNLGNELAVAQCLGGETPISATAASQDSQDEKNSGSKSSVAARKVPHIKSRSWIRERNPKHFTLQLAALSSEQAVKELIKKQSQPGSFAYYRSKSDGRDLYIVIYGSFANRGDAEKAAAGFNSLKPWIRDFGSIQKIMAR